MTQTAPPPPPHRRAMSSRFYLEPADEVVSREQLVKYELQGVVSAGLVESKHVEGPPVDVLRERGGGGGGDERHANKVLSSHPFLFFHKDTHVNTLSTDMTEGG